MSFEEFDDYGDIFSTDETHIPLDEYELARLMQKNGFICNRPGDAMYRRYLEIDLDRVNPAIDPPSESVQRFAEIWTAHVVEKTSIVTTHISGWEMICRFVGWMKAALIENEKNRQQNKTGRYFYPEKGLYLYGFPGRFKTYTAREIAAFLKIPFYDVFTIDREYQKNGATMFDTSAFRALHRDHCIIDDLGAETGHKHYGSASVFAELIKRRMDLSDQRRAVTIITSNLTPKALETADIRAHSNILGMCTPILFGGPDARLQMKESF